MFSPTKQRIIRYLTREIKIYMKYHFFKKEMLSLCFFFVALPFLSQQTIANATDITNYNSGLNLYNTKAYAAAQKMFYTFRKTKNIGSNLKANASYYEAMCAIKLNQQDADKKVLSFVENHPNSNKRNDAFFNVGTYYFCE